MKKLLYTTAIAGLAMTYATVSSAETKITGNLGLSYFASSDNLPSATAKSFDGFGKETQLNIANSGDLNNGMKYAAGFSLEMDGADAGDTTAGQQGQQGENVYIDLISGNTTISIGADHFQNSDKHMTNIVGFGYIGADGASANAVSIYPTHGSNYSSFGVGIAQKTSGGTIGINFTPNNTTGLAANDIGNSITNTAVNGDSATEVSFSGDLGVKGLTVLLAKKMQKNSAPANTRDLDAQRLAARYDMGAFSIAVDSVEKEDGSIKTTGKSIGVAYSVSDKLSIGYTRAKGDSTTASSVDETTDMIAVGYNLGPVSLQAQYKDVENLGGTAVNDGKLLGVYLGTKF